MSGAPVPRGLIIRRPQLPDVPGIRAAHASTVSHDGFSFGFELDELDDEEWIEKVAAEERGIDLPQHLVRATFLIGVVGRDVVARVSVRHELNEALSLYGGHIGYAVVPRVRGRGYATAIARVGLTLLAEEGLDIALVTCDLDNAASIAVIDRLGGVLRDEVVTPDGGRGLRFDVPTA